MVNHNPMKIAIIGGSIWGNRGAAAMLETTIARLLLIQPDLQLAIFTPYPQKDASLAGNSNLQFYDSRPLALIGYFVSAAAGWFWRKLGRKPHFSGAVQALAGSKLLLDVGGITFADGRLIFLPYNILTIWPAMLLGVPVIKLSQAAGSFKNPVIRTLARIFLKRCKMIFARGEKTREYLTELGLPGDIFQPAADAAFCFEPSYCLTKENETAVKQVSDQLDALKRNGIKVIAISPSSLVEEKSSSINVNYTELLLKMINACSQQNIHFVIFPNASRERSKKKRNNDIPVIERLRAAAELSLPLPLYKRITWIAYDLNTAGIDRIVRRADVLVTSRFHAMVFGLRLCVPTLVIGWGHKYLEAMQRFGLEAYVFDYRCADHDLGETLAGMVVQSEDLHQRMRPCLDEVKSSSERQFIYLRGLLDES